MVVAQDCANPNLLYAGSIHNVHAGSARGKGSLSRSTDGGRTWNDITPGTARDEEVWAIAASPDLSGEVFAGTSHARLFRSEDDGHGFYECASFLKLPGRDRWSFPPPPHIPHVRSITFDPHHSDTLYVGVEEGGVYRSRDRGQSFEPLNQGIYSDIHCVLVDTEDSRPVSDYRTRHISRQRRLVAAHQGHQPLIHGAIAGPRWRQWADLYCGRRGAAANVVDGWAGSRRVDVSQRRSWP